MIIENIKISVSSFANILGVLFEGDDYIYYLIKYHYDAYMPNRIGAIKYNKHNGSWFHRDLGGVYEWVFGEEIKKYPFSYMLKTFGQEFLEQTFGDEYNKYFRDATNVALNRFTISDIGKKLVQIGAHILPSLRKEKKFTEQYEKHISHLLKTLDLPSFARLEIIEDVPYVIDATLYINYPDYLKSNERSISTYSNPFELKFKSMLKNYLGVEFGSLAHGKLQLRFATKIENEKEWVKNVLNKEIKKHIKEMPDGNYVHSIRFQPEIEKGYLKIVYKEGSFRHMHQYNFRSKVIEYIKELGYTKIDVDNVEPR